MPDTRTIQIPHEHLVAEMVAFPLAFGASLRVGVHTLDPFVARRKTKRLWRRAERYFVSHFPHVSLDELIATRNLIWFGRRPQGRIRLDAYLQRTAREWLQARGAVAVPRRPGGKRLGSYSPDARRTWRWLTFAMPADLVLAGLARDGQGPDRVNVLCPVVEGLLREGGYPETHLHVGAALDFPTAWAAGVNYAARDMTRIEFESPGADYGDGKALAPWMIRAVIVRYLLGEFLDKDDRESLTTFLNDKGEFLHANMPTHVPAVRHAIRDLQRGRLTAPVDGGAFSAVQNAYRAMTNASTLARPERLDDVQQLDPLSNFGSFTPCGHAGPSLQLQFLWRGLEYLRKRRTDTLFATLFWQVERVRCQVYRHCVQRPLTPGLMNFIRFYDRKSAVTNLLEPIECESSGVLGGVGRGLQSLEIRTSPAGDFNKQLAALRRMREQFDKLRHGTADRDEAARREAWAAMEFGIVLHFLKFRGDPADAGVPKARDRCNHADPAAPANTNCYRWQRFWQERKQRADAIVNAVKREPRLLYFLRGIDVCRDEHGVPTWVVAPLFSSVRRGVEKEIARAPLRDGSNLPTLRTTAHVGEDFVHLATGLRYMDEAARHLPLRNGDRVGHGLALGVEPEEWARKASRLPMPREDRWFDLIWERTWHSVPGARFSADRKALVEEEIERLGREIFRTRHEWTVAGARRFVERLHSRSALRSLGFPRGMLPRETGGHYWRDYPEWLPQHLEFYLYDSGVYLRSRKVQWVDVSEEAPALAELQRLVRRRYTETGITIEVNPISNLLVGDLTDLESHPLWRLAPGLGHKLGSSLQICVGSDDPFPFATTLPEEYQFLYDSLLAAGRSHAEARTWLEGIRKIGLESRFTVPWP